MSRPSASKSIGARGTSSAGSAHPRFRYRLGRLATLPILTIVTIWQTCNVLAGSIAGGCPAGSGQVISPWHRDVGKEKRPIWWISWHFCQQRVHAKLDNHRRRWKNTLELIILPVSGGFYRPTWSPAWPFAGCPLLACGSGNSKRCPVRQGPPQRPQDCLGQEVSVGALAWVFVFRL